MSLTSDMKDELARAIITTPSEVAAEVSATLRFAGGLHLVGGRILVEAELDSPVAARRLRGYLQALYNAESSVVVVSGSSLRRGKRYVVRVVHKADELARMTGLVDSMRRPVRGLPPRPRRVGHSRSLSHLAWCIPCSRLPHGTRTLLFPRNHVPGSRGCPCDGRLRAQARGSCSLEGSTRY